MKTNITNLPSTPGVYVFRDKKGEIMYVGKAIDLKRRVSSYFNKHILVERTKQMASQIDRIDTIQTTSDFEALLLEAKLIKKNQPKYNVIARDDKHPLYIKITREDYPKISVVRREDDKTSTYFGPFPSSRTVRDTLRFLRGVFPYCTDKRLKKKPCFYSFIGLCNPCPNTIETLPSGLKSKEKRKYRSNVRHIERILSGKSSSVIKSLSEQMLKLSSKEEYLRAKEVKERLDKLVYLTSARFSPSAYLENPNLYNDLREREVEELGTILAVPKPNRIEGYDISNISGTSATGSMVVFEQGEKDTSAYRKFKIRSKQTPDDFHMMEEVIKRRLNHYEWELPDLFVVDGGAGQVSTVLSVFEERNIRVPLIGLAKRFEEIIVPVKQGNNLSFKTIRIPIGSPALSLLQRIRDEAHRFARSYHHLLRKKKMVY